MGNSDRPLKGYRRLTFMMRDADVVAVSPSSVWRVLSQGGLLLKWNGKPSKKGTGFEQPLAAHQHWQIDVPLSTSAARSTASAASSTASAGTSSTGDLRERMMEADIEIIMQGAKEKYPEARPRIISDNGPQFIAKDFKEFIRVSGDAQTRRPQAA